MYLHNDDDYQTIWQLAHNWAGKDSHASDPDNLTPEVKKSIHRALVAIRNKLITVRTESRLIFEDEDFFDFLFELPHYLKFNACLKKNRFNKDYLNSLYVWRPEVLRWCANDQLPPPPIWEPKPIADVTPEDEAEDGHWYKGLSDRRKRIAGTLHIANRLWQGNKTLSYEEIWNHEDMKRYDKPRSFPSLETFKEWARDIAPEEAKSPGRRKKPKY